MISLKFVSRAGFVSQKSDKDRQDLRGNQIHIVGLADLLHQIKDEEVDGGGIVLAEVALDDREGLRLHQRGIKQIDALLHEDEGSFLDLHVGVVAQHQDSRDELGLHVVERDFLAEHVGLLDAHQLDLSDLAVKAFEHEVDDVRKDLLLVHGRADDIDVRYQEEQKLARHLFALQEVKKDRQNQ